MSDTPSSPNFSWLVGLDLRPRSAGALTLAKWMHAHSDPKRFHSFKGLHVVETPVVPVDALATRGVAGKAAEKAAAEMLESSGLSDVFDEVTVEETDTAADALYLRADDDSVDGLLVGRRGTKDGKGLVRLGRVARRLTRRLPKPLVVVPPDLESIGAGPIVVATDATKSSDGAANFALALAATLGRSLVFASSVGLNDAVVGLAYVPVATWKDVQQGTLRQVRQRLDKWLDERNLGAHESRILEGATVIELAHLGQELDACMIVCGSRELSVVERLFSASTGTALAGMAAQAVAIVPPDWKQG